MGRIAGSTQAKTPIPAGAEPRPRCFILIFDAVPAGYDPAWHQRTEGLCPTCAEEVKHDNRRNAARA